MQHDSTQKTAILFFANSAEEESRHKCIRKGDSLFSLLTRLTIKEIKNVGLPYFHYSEQHQVGSSFGDRFANAIQSIFDKGFENIITVGNDTPQLNSSHLNDALNALAKGKNVLGPSTDGGFYLMGLQRQSFEKAAFRALPWQTHRLYEATKDYLGETDKIKQLAFLIDIDSTADIRILLRKNAKSLSKTLQKLFQSILKRTESLLKEHTSPVLDDNFYTLPHLTRGSPRFTV
ncbi:DUF2064 domain-containing protein [Allomuricauda sp. d1]|uniref:TIGR04282 family arsenosugar biosynthesis glycosyltransferase n=1 Tax=Allomuricauda sp. d1 TaxID=3136725 RepID=UPI0031DD240C